MIFILQPLPLLLLYQPHHQLLNDEKTGKMGFFVKTVGAVNVVETEATVEVVATV